MFDHLHRGVSSQERESELGALLSWAQDELARGGVLRPRPNAERLMAHVLEVERYRLYLDFSRAVPGEETRRFETLVKRRAAGEPLQYLTGSTEFMSLPFITSPAALIPRPETEILVETTLMLLSEGRGSRRVVPLPHVVEVGTGSGAVALSLAHYLPRTIIHATEVSPAALALARENALAMGLGSRVRFLAGDLFGPLGGRGLEGTFALVASNPPYVPSAEIPELPREVREHEPLVAVDGGPDGLSTVRRLVAEAPAWLRPGGFLAFEVGAGQAPRARELLEEKGFWQDVRVVKDYTGIDRVLVAELGGKS